MAKEKRKKFVAQTFKLSPALVARLNAYSETTGVTKTFAVEKAISIYLDEKMPEGGKSET